MVKVHRFHPGAYACSAAEEQMFEAPIKQPQDQLSLQLAKLKNSRTAPSEFDAKSENPTQP
jgi:hypothetical protein